MEVARGASGHAQGARATGAWPTFTEGWDPAGRPGTTSRLPVAGGQGGMEAEARSRLDTQRVTLRGGPMTTRAVAQSHVSVGPEHLSPQVGRLTGLCRLGSQGDVLITSCTYNTEDRELATVVSPTSPCPPAPEPLPPGASRSDCLHFQEDAFPHLGRRLLGGRGAPSFIRSSVAQRPTGTAG